ncbi:MAG TPA: DUF1839 family protein, partial [Myxococcota bacterium]|nr:DUF1839 family protein [Myxococcota bacterium]
LRQYGACFELAATYLRWLGGQGVPDLEQSAACFDQISQSTKQLQFQLARSMMRRRPLDIGGLAEPAALWERGMGDLLQKYG